MNLYGIAIYAEQIGTKNFYIGIHFAIAPDKDMAIEATILYCKNDRPDFGMIIAEATEAPIDKEMLPRISENIKWRSFMDIAKENTLT